MIPLKKRMEVLKLYFEGLSYDEISKAARISKGSVVNIVRELMKGSIPNVL
jgi:DNA-directed RNA polymerase specialized sigma24 family protein